NFFRNKNVSQKSSTSWRRIVGLTNGSPTKEALLAPQGAVRSQTRSPRMKSKPSHSRSVWQRGLLLATVLASFGLIGMMTGTWPGTADAQPERYVDPVNGDDTANDCSDEANPCQTIAHAITQASDPDTIILAAGTYNEADLLIDGID